MYLKKIEVQGFKSFANKIIFDFHRGITGIVGPNGSGKSNISDAVRWVLGEQSAKQLRGQNMQDVIFSGTELRKPLGYAFVAITMDNADRALTIDFDEVTISRHIYRSGESEYRINNSVCRLKDVSELLYDTGIGREGYSIIGQGQVDKILSKKSEDRRELFDEAAGITKYKRRKELAQKKLENERANLLRISDIVDELEKQVAPLKKQSDTAKQYLKLRNILKDTETLSFIIEYDGLEAKLSDTAKNEVIVKEDLAQAQEIHDKLKRRYIELEATVSGLEAELEIYRQKQVGENIKQQKNKSKIELLKEQINSEKINSEHINSRIINIDKDVQDKSRALEQYKNKSEQLIKDYAETEASHREAVDRLAEAEKDLKLLSQKIEAAKERIIASIQKRADLSSQQQKYELILEQGRIRKSEIANRILAVKSEESEFNAKYRHQKSLLNTLLTEIEAVLSEIHSREEDKKEYEKRISILSSSLSDMQRCFQTASARLESMKNIAERYEGYGNSIKQVMDTRDRLRGIHGVVADIITLDKQYETAVETALGGRIQNIVTDSEETAKILVEYLKKHKYGRATFLPLSAMKANRAWDAGKLLKERGVIGVASSLVHTEELFSGLINYLLGRIIVVDNIDNAISFAKKYHYEYRLVTLEGESINPGGAISGGAFKNESNLLGRKREIEELEAKTSDSLKKYENFYKELNTVRERLTLCKQNLKALNEKRQEQLLQKSKIEMLINSVDKNRDEIKAGLDQLLAENIKIDEEINQTGQLKYELSEVLKELEARDKTIEKASIEESAEFENRKMRREELALEVNRLVLNISSLKQNIDYAKENLTRLQNETAALNREKIRLSLGIGDSEKNIKNKNTEIERAEAEIMEAEKAEVKLLEKFKIISEERGLKAKELKSLFGENDAASKHIAELDKELLRLMTQKERIEERAAELSAYMWNEYEITYKSAREADYKPDKADKTNLRKAVDGLKSDIKALGNININAIEDYREISERYELMKTQHEDIVQSENRLVQIIDELDTGMRKQFNEKFKEIAQQFNEVFKELFGGGSTRLEIEEAADILEADIGVVAQPPGKKLQNMLQLSGGEKALTAIALLFAIQNLKPSPFALLDEIEAALDDSNVDRFARYLHKLSDRTQFIVITHRRGTMVGSDRLYGITMQEKGVSTLVSVNLVENDLS